MTGIQIVYELKGSIVACDFAEDNILVVVYMCYDDKSNDKGRGEICTMK